MCLLNQFHCDNNNCLSVSNVCNDIDDCGDLSDENFDCPPGKSYSPILPILLQIPTYYRNPL